MHPFRSIKYYTAIWKKEEDLDVLAWKDNHSIIYEHVGGKQVSQEEDEPPTYTQSALHGK